MIDISKFFNDKGILNKHLREEIEDHFMSLYEELNALGTSEQEIQKVMEKRINSMDLISINASYNKLYPNNKIRIMSFLAVLISLLLLSTWELPMDPPTKIPLLDNTYKISSGFGERPHPIKKITRFHNGVDFRAKQGTTVIAPSAGKVIEASYDSKLGNYIVIKHDEIYTTRYHHLHSNQVQAGDSVTAGQKIGEVGSTGLSTAPHLHYEVLENGKRVNPENFLKV